MPSMNFNLNDFCNLVGRRFSKEKILDKLPMMLGVEWLGSRGDELIIKVPTNRPDLLSVEGLARASRSFIGLKKGLINFDLAESDYFLKISKSVKSVRPFLSIAVIKGVKLTDDVIKSLIQLREKLQSYCSNGIKAFIGIHDLRAVKFPLNYTIVETSSSKFIPINSSKAIALNQLSEQKESPVILSADDEVISLPGIATSELTKLRSSTNDLLIEVTGTDSLIVSKVLSILVASLIERKTKVYSVIVREGKFKHAAPDLSPSRFKLDINYCNKLLGIKLSSKRVIGLLERMGYGIKHKDDQLIVEVPCYRLDVLHPIDLVEDLAVAYGYAKFNHETPLIPSVGSELPKEETINLIRERLASYGYNEVINCLLTNQDVLFNKMLAVETPVVKLLNSKSSEHNLCRNSLTPLIINLLSLNKHNDYPQAIFEVGDVLIRRGNEVIQDKRLCFAKARNNSNYTEVKLVAENLLSLLNVKFKTKDFTSSSFIKDRASAIRFGKEQIGFFGDVNPEVLNNFGIKIPVAICEIRISGLI